MKRKGFLLLELLIVIALVITINSLSMVVVSWYDRYLVRLEVERLYAAMIMTYQYALSTHTRQVIVFDSVHNCYLTPYGNESLVRGVIFGVNNAIKGPPSSPTKVLDKPITFKNNRAVFYEQGIIDAGTVYIIDKTRNHQYALSCGVSDELYIRCYYYYQKRWMLVR